MLNKDQVNKRVEQVMALTGEACGTFADSEFDIPELELLTTENLLSYADRNGCSDVEYVLNLRFRDYVDVLEQALFQLDVCFSQISNQSDNELICDDDTGNSVSVESVRAFLVDNLDKA